jgi:glutamate racemase
MGNAHKYSTPRAIFMDTTMKDTFKPIGVFDSGSGGLTVLRVLQQRFQHEQFVYYADTANLPYGTKSPAEIITFTRNAFRWLQDVAHVKMIVVACNTSSSLALETIKHKFDIPIVGTIYPLVNQLLNNAKHKNIGIIATPASAQSKMHERILKAHGFKSQIEIIACPDFVPLIEAPERDTQKIISAARTYLEPFHTQQLDTLIYGCTHYPLIADIIESLLPPTMHYIDPSYAIADAVAALLDEKKLRTPQATASLTRYCCTRNPELFAHKVAQIMNVETTVTCLK